MKIEQATRVYMRAKALVSSILTDEATQAAWVQALAPFDEADAAEALEAVATEQLPAGRGRFCEPGDVVARIKAIRADRVQRREKHREQIGGAPPADPAQGIAWRRQTDRILAAPGFDPDDPQHVALAHAKVAAAVEAAKVSALEAPAPQPDTKRSHGRRDQLKALTGAIGHTEETK